MGTTRGCAARPDGGRSADPAAHSVASSRCGSATRGIAMIDGSSKTVCYRPADRRSARASAATRIAQRRRGVRRDARLRLSRRDRADRRARERSHARARSFSRRARDWDFRARNEPIPHVSSHGALHRDHMLVPLLTNRPVAHAPRRTVDVMPSALTALGLGVPVGLDGVSFLVDRGHDAHASDGHLARERPDDQRGAESAVA